MELTCTRYPFQTGVDLRGGGGGGAQTGCYSVCVSVACVSSNTDNDKAAISRERKNLKKTTHTGVEVK